MYEDFNNSNIYDNSGSEDNGGQMVPNGFIPEEPKKPKKKKAGQGRWPFSQRRPCCSERFPAVPWWESICWQITSTSSRTPRERN